MSQRRWHRKTEYKKCEKLHANEPVAIKENIELLTSEWVSSECTSWISVTIIGHDPLAMCGIRYLLQRCGSVKLQIITSLPEEDSVLDSSDLVIWIRMRHDGLPELAGHVVSLCRKFHYIRQLVISDAIPTGMASGITPISGVWLSHGNVKMNELHSLLRKILTTKRASSPLLTCQLGEAQWRVLLMRATGANTHTIAEICGIGVKTVSVHESAIRKRLGTKKRGEYIWLLRSAEQIHQAVPALGRNLFRNRKK